jgi:predicted nucleic acid-binding Zn ribbon protein
VGLDIEHQHRAEAEAWLDQHCPEWRQGLVAQSQRNGLHVYCLSRQPVRTTKHPWGDVKGSSSLVFVPPSKAYKPDANRDYEWLVFNPEAALRLESTALPWPDASEENDHQVERLDVAKVLAGVPLGQRNQTLFRLACRLRGAGVPLEWTTRLVAEAAANCIPPWGSASDEEPVERLVERVYQRYQPKPSLVVSNGEHEFVSPRISDDRGETNPIPDGWHPVPISELDTGSTTATGWIWDGYLAKGHVTDFYGFWKSGKSTLVAALLQRLADGGELAGREVRPGRALVISEEPRTKWIERREALGLADHVHIVSRPFPKRPNHAEWLAFTSHIAKLVTENGYDLVILDSLPNLWPVRDENDASETVTALLPLQTIATAGCAVLFLRHPRKSDGLQATAGRGSGAISGFADIIIEMRRYVPDDLQDTRRLLTVYSRYDCFETVIRWNGDGEYEALGSPAAYSAEAQRERLLEALAELGTATTGELAKAAELPHGTVSRRLSELEAAGLVVRTGGGRRGDPFRWTLASGDPDGDDFVSPTKTPMVGETKTDGKPENPHQNCEKALHTPVDHTSGSSDEHENPHQNCKKALHTCVVCGQAIPQVSGQATRYCSTACRVKAYRQRRSSADTPGQVPVSTSVEKAESGPPDPSVCLDCGKRIDAEGFQYICPPCLKRRYDRLQRQYPEKLTRWLQQQHGR